MSAALCPAPGHVGKHSNFQNTAWPCPAGRVQAQRGCWGALPDVAGGKHGVVSTLLGVLPFIEQHE